MSKQFQTFLMLAGVVVLFFVLAYSAQAAGLNRNTYTTVPYGHHMTNGAAMQGQMGGGMMGGGGMMSSGMMNQTPDGQGMPYGQGMMGQGQGLGNPEDCPYHQDL